MRRQKAQELLGRWRQAGLRRLTMPDFHIERREQGGRTVALVSMGHRARAPS